MHVLGFRVTALRDDGSMWAFGSGSHGGVALVPTLVDNESLWVDVATNIIRGSCGIRDDRTLWCSANTFIQGQWARPLQLIDGRTDHTKLVSSPNGVCALTTSGAVRCHSSTGDGSTWGEISGFLGEPWPEAVLADVTGGYTLHCALTADGRRFCGGVREKGSIGDGFD